MISEHKSTAFISYTHKRVYAYSISVQEVQYNVPFFKNMRLHAWETIYFFLSLVLISGGTGTCHYDNLDAWTILWAVQVMSYEYVEWQLCFWNFKYEISVDMAARFYIILGGAIAFHSLLKLLIKNIINTESQKDSPHTSYVICTITIHI